ncbi:MAG: sulfatase [Planctomycetota bacterium]
MACRCGGARLAGKAKERFHKGECVAAIRFSFYLFLAFIASSCGSEESAGEATGRYNLLFISMDSARRDFFSAYGYAPPFSPHERTTPFIDALAGQGVLMEDAYATTSWTLPSHLSMLTGQPELVHAVDIDYHTPDPDLPMLAEIMKGQGYRTAGFYSGTYLASLFGFNRGFDRYEACFGEKLVRLSQERESAVTRLKELEAEAGKGSSRSELLAAREERIRVGQALEDESHRDVSSESVTRAVISELKSAARSDQPFFVFAHYFDVHHDYMPPAPYDAIFDPGYDGKIEGDDFMRNEKISTLDMSKPGARKQVLSDRDLEHIRALYAGELAWVDSQIERIVKTLDELGLSQKTLVVLTADHGDEFFEHGSLGHRLTLFEEVVQVPLIMRFPGRLPAGLRVPGLVSTIDILPTLMELLDLPLMKGTMARSFLPLIEGRQDGANRHILGRLVRTFEITLRVPVSESATGRVPGKLVLVREVFRKGRVKICRERSWTRPMQDLSPEAQADLERSSREMFNKERLSWVDVERYPDESFDKHTTLFIDPEARAALKQFHDLYAALLKQRGRSGLQENKDAYREMLTGLGYVDGGEPGAVLTSQEFLLPPPGQSVLSED